MACIKCDHRGYILSSRIGDGKISSTVIQCQNCKDIKAYTRKVQEMMGIKPDRGNVIEFRKEHGSDTDDFDDCS